MRAILAFLAISLAVAQPAQSADPERSLAIRAAAATAKFWRPHYDRPDAWLAQLWAESRHRTDATSPVGACGIAQFMPATWLEVGRQYGLAPGTSCRDLVAVEVGAFYMRRLRGSFPIAANEEERQRMTRAAYNAGPGHIVKARRLCDAETWMETAECLPRITGRHAEETRGYVARIDQLIACKGKFTLSRKRARQERC